MTIDNSKNKIHFVLIQCNVVTIVATVIVLRSNLLPNLEKKALAIIK